MLPRGWTDNSPYHVGLIFIDKPGGGISWWSYHR